MAHGQFLFPEPNPFPRPSKTPHQPSTRPAPLPLFPGLIPHADPIPSSPRFSPARPAAFPFPARGPGLPVPPCSLPPPQPSAPPSARLRPSARSHRVAYPSLPGRTHGSGPSSPHPPLAHPLHNGIRPGFSPSFPSEATPARDLGPPSINRPAGLPAPPIPQPQTLAQRQPPTVKQRTPRRRGPRAPLLLCDTCSLTKLRTEVRKLLVPLCPCFF